MKTVNLFACINAGDKFLSGAVREGSIPTENWAREAMHSPANAKIFFDFDYFYGEGGQMCSAWQCPDHDDTDDCDCPDSHGKSILRLYDVPEPIAELLCKVCGGDPDIVPIGCIDGYAAYRIATAFLEPMAGGGSAIPVIYSILEEDFDDLCEDDEIELTADERSRTIEMFQEFMDSDESVTEWRDLMREAVERVKKQAGGYSPTDPSIPLTDEQEA